MCLAKDLPNKGTFIVPDASKEVYKKNEEVEYKCAHAFVPRDHSTYLVAKCRKDKDKDKSKSDSKYEDESKSKDEHDEDDEDDEDGSKDKSKDKSPLVWVVKGSLFCTGKGTGVHAEQIDVPII